MATTGIINGTLMRIHIGGTAIAYATNCSISFNRAVRETLTKDSTSGWREIQLGQGSATISTDGLHAEVGDSTTNERVDELFGYLNSKTALTITYTTGVTGDSVYTCTAYCSSLEINHPVEENSTYSAKFEVDGAPVRTTLA